MELEERTLSNIGGEFARLIYLASTRDYNTGRYYHGGLAVSFSPEAAQAALADCHERTFNRIALLQLNELLEEIVLYTRSAQVSTSELLKTWQILEPYRIAIPKDCNPVAAELFCSNVKIALAILQEERWVSEAG